MTNSAFDDYSQYYDILYGDKSYVEEVGYVNNLMKGCGFPGGDILEFGSGTGGHGCLLVSKGYRVHGIERSLKMIQNAVIKDGFTCEYGDACTVKLNKKFDIVLALFHVVSYQTSNDSLEAIFKNAAMHLKKGGLFIFDFWYTPAVNNFKPSVRVKRVANDEFSVTRIAEPTIYENKNMVDVNYTIFIEHNEIINSNKNISFKETHSMRHLSLPEIEFLSKYCGFKLIKAEEFLTGSNLSETTWSACVVLERV